VSGFFAVLSLFPWEERFILEGRGTPLCAEDPLLLKDGVKSVGRTDKEACIQGCTPGGTHPGKYTPRDVHLLTHPGRHIYSRVYLSLHTQGGIYSRVYLSQTHLGGIYSRVYLSHPPWEAYTAGCTSPPSTYKPQGEPPGREASQDLKERGNHAGKRGLSGPQRERETSEKRGLSGPPRRGKVLKGGLGP